MAIVFKLRIFTAIGFESPRWCDDARKSRADGPFECHSAGLRLGVDARRETRAENRVVRFCKDLFQRLTERAMKHAVKIHGLPKLR
ncbi:hypothetical protein [Burkholderia guangdongensis]|uniref:hypothetical protein n=1 Tax=Burkholderia guangdongensis TaxID=1792500 RepID=UPI0015CD6825|nr:hypothetical protein [Burkholderia guangdongensis]